MKPLQIAVVTMMFALPVQALAETLQECTGPFRPCAIEVQATCSTDPGGRLRFTFPDTWGNWPRWERCVGRIFEANGQRDPFKLPPGSSEEAGRQVNGPLTVPYTEMMYPKNYGRD